MNKEAGDELVRIEAAISRTLSRLARLNEMQAHAAARRYGEELDEIAQRVLKATSYASQLEERRSQLQAQLS